MYNNRTFYFFDRKGKLALDIDKWRFVDENPIIKKHTYTNLTNATLKRLERIIKLGDVHNPSFRNNRIWLPVWFHGRVHLD